MGRGAAFAPPQVKARTKSKIKNQRSKIKIMGRALILFVVVVASATAAFAQAPNPGRQAPPADMVEVEPITCWWRTSVTAVRTAEPFDIRLTCSVVETETNKVVADFSKLDPTVVQLPPFEVLGGTHAGDLTVPGKRFFQYDYRLRLMSEDLFGGDVPIPPLEISYRIESQVAGGDTAQGREQSYVLPRASVRLISIVPDDTSDIREAPASAFTRIEDRDSRANLLQTIATVLFALAGVIVVMMLVGMIRRKTKSEVRTAAHVAPRTILAAVNRELDEVQRASRGGWTPELAGRALAALRIAAAYAAGKGVGQRAVTSTDAPVEGELVVTGPLGRGRAFVSGSATTESASGPNAPHGLAEAMKTLTAARYGRAEMKGDIDDAIATAIRVTRQQQSAHSLPAEWGRNFSKSVVDLRRKVWA
jgi:hypothetical protein